MHTYDIGATLRQYAMSIHLNDFLESVEVKQVVADAVGSDYYLAPLFATGEHTRGHEQTWRFKHFTKDGREIEDDELARLRTFDGSPGARFHKMPRYDNPRIHSDLSGEHYALFMDAPMGIGIFHDGRPLAFIAFSLRDKTTLLINQMQSVKVTHYDRYGRVTHEAVPPQVTSMPLQHVLTQVTELFASQYGCAKIMIQSGENNKRTKEMTTERVYNKRSGEVDDVKTNQEHLSQKNAHRIYDLFAQKQGYTKDDERGDWIKDL